MSDPFHLVDDSNFSDVAASPGCGVFDRMNQLSVPDPRHKVAAKHPTLAVLALFDADEKPPGCLGY